MYVTIPAMAARIGIRNNIHGIKEVSLGSTTERSKLAISGLTKDITKGIYL
jgi:hypothetical protein